MIPSIPKLSKDFNRNILGVSSNAIGIPYSDGIHASPKNIRKSGSDKYQTHDEKASYLARETGMELILAEEYLASNNWNLEKTLSGYQDLKAQEIANGKAIPSNSNHRKTLSQTGRGLSASNIQLLEDIRHKIYSERSESTFDEFEKFDGSSKSTFVLPDIDKFEKELGDYIRADLTCVNTLKALVNSARLNWWAEVGACRKLFPLSTVGDGNCLLHAASLGMWGFHDRCLLLRKALHKLFQHPQAKRSLRRRWKYQSWQDNLKCGGLNYTVSEWDEEWNIIINLASDRPRQFENGSPARRISRTLSYKTLPNDCERPHLREGESLDSLEAIHVYALSVLLCRPIIVISETMLKDWQGNDLAPIPFGGIYLPIERKPEDCIKYPLVLAYHNAHFSPLVAADGEFFYKGQRLSNSVPVYDQSLLLLPLRFAIDPGVNWDLVQDDSIKEEKPALTYEDKIRLLRQYLDLVRVTMIKRENPMKQPNNSPLSPSCSLAMSHINNMFIGQPTNELLAARLDSVEMPKHYNEMISNYINSLKYQLQSLKRVKCKTPKCSNNADIYSKSDICVSCSKQSSSLNNSPPSYLPSSPPPAYSYNSKSKSSSPNISLHNVNEPPPYHSIEHKLKKPNHIDLVPNFNMMSITPGHISGRSSPAGRSKNSSQSNSPIIRKKDFDFENKDSRNSSAASSPKREDYTFLVGTQCLTNGCKFYGGKETKGYCSSCYKQMKYKKQTESQDFIMF